MLPRRTGDVPSTFIGFAAALAVAVVAAMGDEMTGMNDEMLLLLVGEPDGV